MKRLTPERLIGSAIVVAGVGLVAVLIAGFVLTGSDSPSPSPARPSQIARASATSAATPAPTATSQPSPTPTASPTRAPVTADPTKLPSLLGAIGDSYTQAWSVSPTYKYDHPQFSWAVGTAKGDGVFSLRERFEALGAKLTVVDAATSGRKMDDSIRQANAVVDAAKGLPKGSIAYVVFELGTNDLCDAPMTSMGDFEVELRSAVAILRWLPTGSRILMLSVPDFSHFNALAYANSRARSSLATRSGGLRCPPFLGKNTKYTMDQAKATLAGYNQILYKVCDEIEVTDGAIGKLHCTHNEALLSESNFVLSDLSTADYFHPSLSGQAKMAAAAWSAGIWADTPLPPGAKR